MRINAYILAADPACIEGSVLSYYDFVENIIVSYDENRVGYTGVPVAVNECLERLKSIDRGNKILYSPGHYARLEFKPMENETHQRQCALVEASKGSDWVLQLDTDEVISDQASFLSCLRQADADGFYAMDYPARWLYQQVGKSRFLEMRTRLWRVRSYSPGPVAVKSYINLKYARQTEVATFYVDFAATERKIEQKSVHRVIPASKAIFHYSWVRTERQLRSKFISWSHAQDRDWSQEIDRWIWSKRHPYLAVLQSPFVRHRFVKYLGLVDTKQTVSL